MIKRRMAPFVHYGTLAEFTASTRKFKKGDILLPTDSAEFRIATGDDVFADLGSTPTAKIVNIAELGAIDPLTVISAEFADLPAARTAVNTMRTETEARLAAAEAKIDAILSGLVSGLIMESPA